MNGFYILLAFVPIGLLVGCVFGRVRWWKVLLCGAGFSLLIETVQFLTRRGFAEFDDLFHNVLGCLVGYGVCIIFNFIVGKWCSFEK